MRIVQITSVCAAISVAILTSGCYKKPLLVRESFRRVPAPESEIIPQESALPVAAYQPYAPLQSYPLRAADQLSFTLSVAPVVQPNTYRLMVNDEITVEYLHEPTRQPHRTIVLPDGSVDLPRIGRVHAAGKSVEELKKEVTERIKEFYRYPVISVTTTKAMRGAEELRRAFSSGFTNQSLTLTVSPDGYLDFPILGRHFVQGRTLPEVRDEVNRLYSEVVPGVSVWPSIVQRAPDRVYVLGRVPLPGEFLLDRPYHVSQVLAQSGYEIGSDLGQIVLIRYREGAPRAIRLNLNPVAWQDVTSDQVDLTDDVLVADGDVIVVPRDKIQKWNDRIRRILVEGAYAAVPEDLR